MKRSITANRKKPYTVTVSKLRKAIFSRDVVRLESACSDLGKVPDAYRTWADKMGIDYQDLKTLSASYIIDTMGHVDFAMLSDDEDLDQFVYESMHDVLRSAVIAIKEDLEAYNKDYEVVVVEVKLDIYGYGSYHLTLKDRRGLLYAWGKERAYPCDPSYGIDGLYSRNGSGCFISFEDAVADNTSFKREQVRDIVKYLSIPLEKLKR